jgi:alanine racemase
VMALRARPVRVADLPAGWGISYGPSFTTSRPSRIATLPLGYGDGWSR